MEVNPRSHSSIHKKTCHNIIRQQHQIHKLPTITSSEQKFFVNFNTKPPNVYSMILGGLAPQVLININVYSLIHQDPNTKH